MAPNIMRLQSLALLLKHHDPIRNSDLSKSTSEALAPYKYSVQPSCLGDHLYSKSELLKEVLIEVFLEHTPQSSLLGATLHTSCLRAGRRAAEKTSENRSPLWDVTLGHMHSSPGSYHHGLPPRGKRQRQGVSTKHDPDARRLGDRIFDVAGRRRGAARGSAPAHDDCHQRTKPGGAARLPRDAGARRSDHRAVGPDVADRGTTGNEDGALESRSPSSPRSSCCRSPG